MMKNSLILITLACLVSCQTSGDESVTDEKKPTAETPAAPAADAPDTEEKPAPSAAFDVSKPDSLIGQPLEKVKAACEAANVRCRVVEIDGKPLIVTMDFLAERLNFKVKDGLITEVSKG
jgi:hypothetical protein